MNPESLDSTIQSALSTLYPPFEATAPTVLSQLFRVIEERYQGDALQCLLDFLIPAKRILESVQQAACAAYSDVLFKCEGWPLCLHERVVIQLASLNPLLLRPGDFYLQVAPFANQAARIVLKSLLEEHRQVEETPISETAYPCIFTEDWLSDVNRDRHGTPLHRCLLSTDQGVVKVPWAQVAIPEFVDKPKAMASPSSSIPVAPETFLEPPLPPPVSCSPFSLEPRIQPAKDGIAVSLRLVEAVHHSGSVKVGGTVMSGKPVGWVSPSTWDGRHTRDLEGDYVDLVEFTKEKETRTEAPLPKLPDLKPVRPAPPVPPTYRGDPLPCGRVLSFSEEPCTPCQRRKLGQVVGPQELRCRYRDSYMAALQNPVSFEARTMLVIPEESPPVRQGGGVNSEIDVNALSQACDRYCFHSERPCQTSAAHKGNTSPLGHLAVQNFKKTHKNVGKSLTPSPSTVSEISRKCPMMQRQSKRSNSDIFPEMIPRVHIVQCKKTTAFGLVSPKLERRKSSKKDVTLLSKAEALSSPAPVSVEKTDLQTSQAEKQSSPQFPPSPKTSAPPPAPCLEPSSCLLHLGLVCLPGSRDRTGRAVMEVYGDHHGWVSPLVSKQELCNLLHHLHSVPRKEVRTLGLTVVVDARKKSPPETLFKALLMVQVLDPHIFNHIQVLVDKETSPRPERYPGLQMDVVTSMKALHRSVEAQQLTSQLDGSFPYNHSDWLRLCQKLDPFMSDLQEASRLLRRAVEKLSDIRRVDSVQEVQLRIREHKALMREVLEDTRLVALQREGGSKLARLRREETRFSHSEDYRDIMHSVTGLYNQVEEQVHALVMKSNESLQHLDFLLHLRDLEDRFKKVMDWFTEEGERQLVEANADLDTLGEVEQALQRLSAFLAQTSVQNQHAVTLIAEAEKMEGASYPETGAFRSMVHIFKTSLADFSQRAERCRSDLQTLASLFRFCEKATDLAKECRLYMDQLKPGCHSAKSHLPALKNFQERFCEFSAEQFKDAKAQASVCSRGTRVWNVAWLNCQEAKGQLQERLFELDRAQRPVVGVAEPGCQTKEDGSHSLPSPRVTSSHPGDMSQGQGQPGGRLQHCATAGNSSRVTCFNIPFSGKAKMVDAEAALSKLGSKDESAGTSEEHDGDAGFGEEDPTDGQEQLSGHRTLDRSLSEGATVSYCHVAPPESSCPLALALAPARAHGQPSCRILKAAQHYQISRHGSFCTDESCGMNSSALKTILTASCAVVGPDSKSPVGEAHVKENSGSDLKLRRIAEELLATEREYVSSLGYVTTHYIPELQRPDVTQGLRGQRGCIFGNLENIHDFHLHSFLPELEGCANEPHRVGRCFLRHKEGFALYALYSKNKPQSDILLSQHGNTFFKQKQTELGDKMDLWSYLLKPVQRISKYSLLLQDMVKECGTEHTRGKAEIQAALVVIRFHLRHGNDLLAMDDIQDCDVNLKEQGQLIRQDEFLVSFRKKKCFRHIFLFQDLILFSKTKRTEVGNDVYIYKQSFKTSDIGMTHTSGSNGLCFEIWFRRRKSQDTYILQAESEEAKKAWTSDLERILWEQALHNREIRMQERVFLGIGNKPFMDIKPSDAAISDRAVNCGLIGGESKVSTQGALILPRPYSIGSGSSASSSESRSSFSSGRGSMSAIGYLCDQPQIGNGLGIFSATTPLDDDDLDNENECFHLLMDSSESSGESVSGFSSSDQMCLSVIGGEADDTSSVCSSPSFRKQHALLIAPRFHIHAAPATSRQCSFASPIPKAPMSHKPSRMAKEFDPVGKSTEV